ncbi:hypothetical protein [Flammeovirga sp. EKP202]|uniref:ISAon1 family transposase N-terminal region protein n=1 Tax=Flammeovirga sp. EKP202 TaxID=2770592 RepID=UPI00165EFBFC|nr:hypothetical protein [Flammeovirga sp. EKP202]MBD0405515.1 hypothetical protein [Flammeovirga sp. EKP202]
MNDDLLALFFPEGMLDYFEIEDYTNSSTELQIYLKEKDIPPVEYSHLSLQKRGFHNPKTIEDFPIRGKKVKLIVKRRRWAEKDNHLKLSRDWKLVAKGTRMSEEYASFLKALARY